MVIEIIVGSVIVPMIVTLSTVVGFFIKSQKKMSEQLTKEGNLRYDKSINEIKKLEEKIINLEKKLDEAKEERKQLWENNNSLESENRELKERIIKLNRIIIRYKKELEGIRNE